MTVPRRLVPGRAHAICRRTSQRKLLLLPSDRVRQVTGFSFGLALKRSPGVRPLAFMGNTTHHHGNLIDQGRLDGPKRKGELEQPSGIPAFLGVLHALMARALNTHYGQSENFWRPGSYDNVEIHDQAALEEQLFYTWLQPVKDGLVRRVADWPAFKIMPNDFGTTIKVYRPDDAFFGGFRPARAKPTHPDALAAWQAELVRQERVALELGRARRREADKKRGRTSKRRQKLEADRDRRRLREQARRDLARANRESRPQRDRSRLPAFVEIPVGVPPGWEDRPIEETRAHFNRGIKEREDAIHADFAATGRTFMGLEAVMAQDPRKSAGEPLPTFGLNPRIACKDLDTRLDALEGLKAWREEMHKARDEWAKGKGDKRDVVFPRGAFGVWRFHGALVAGGHKPRRRPRRDPEGRDAPT
jgi:hypothetical protein